MGTKLLKSEAAKANALAVLDAAPGEDQVLLIRNRSMNVLAIRPGIANQDDLVLGLYSEEIVPREWARSRTLRRMAGDGQIQVQWVDAFYDPWQLPRIEDAPLDILPEGRYEREYARQISLRPEADALAAIAVTARVPHTASVDARYMKESFRRVLELARWLEERTQKRKTVLAAIVQRLDEVRAL